MTQDPKKPSVAHHLRDGAGHLSPKVAADVLARVEGEAPAEERAFFRAAHTSEPLAEQLGESFVAQITNGGEESVDEPGEAETGGPFVETTGNDEFARGTDRSNPRDATREPFPTT
jgi:hypothetical protein